MGKERGEMNNKTVLIADDAEFMRGLIKDVLSKYDYDVVGEANNADDAIKKYTELKPDLVTMDIVMGEKSGVDAVKCIIEENPKAIILMISAMGQQAMMVDAIAAGAKGFVVKPFNPEVLMEEVKRILG